MLLILGIMTIGIAVGYVLRHKRLGFLDAAVTCAIWLLLFLLGVDAGSDDRIVRWIASLGLEAFVISLAGVLGSSVFAYLLWAYVRRGKGGAGER